MGKHLVLVGGGHAHMTTLLKLGEFVGSGHDVTLVTTSPYQFYSGMGPGLLSGIYHEREVRFNVGKMVEDRGGSFIEDRVVKIDGKNRQLLLSSGNVIGYDVVSFNTGSEVPLPMPVRGMHNIFPVKPIENLLAARDLIIGKKPGERMRVSVIGGGPAGVEVSAGLWHLSRSRGISCEISLISASEILSDFPGKVRSLARSSLAEKGIALTEGDSAAMVEDGVISLESGKTVRYDAVLAATGVTPPSHFTESGLPTGEDGGLLVNDYLQSVAYPEMFGGGDCIALKGKELARVGVYAVRQNPVLYRNLVAYLSGKELIPFDPGGSYLLILNMGDEKGILRKQNFIFDGRVAFRIKDYIDRRFMKKFQVSGETGL